jgi:hypothetical protein
MPVVGRTNYHYVDILLFQNLSEVSGDQARRLGGLRGDHLQSSLALLVVDVTQRDALDVLYPKHLAQVSSALAPTSDKPGSNPIIGPCDAVA